MNFHFLQNNGVIKNDDVMEIQRDIYYQYILLVSVF